MHRAAAALAAALAAASVATPSGVEAEVAHASGLAVKKDARDVGAAHADEPPPLLGTLVQTHTGEHLALDTRSPSDERFSNLLADRVTGEVRPLDPRLLGLLRALAEEHPGARVELVSGYRSPKLNEMMRKKGHHVASHSQHSLGHAVDFRLVLPTDTRGMDPRMLEREIRALGWEGGVGVYTRESDWFVHADVGRQRRWRG